MVNQLIKWQMRKIGYTMGLKNGLGAAVGVEFADKQFAFLEWLQDLYDSNCLKGAFYTNDIVKEIWDTVKRHTDPLQELEDGYNEMYEKFMMTIEGDIEKTGGNS